MYYLRQSMDTLTCNTDTVDEIRHKFTPFSDRSGNNCGSSGGERILEEPEGVLVLRDVMQGKIVVANKVVPLSKGESITNKPVRDTRYN